MNNTPKSHLELKPRMMFVKFQEYDLESHNKML